MTPETTIIIVFETESVRQQMERFRADQMMAIHNYALEVDNASLDVTVPAPPYIPFTPPPPLPLHVMSRRFDRHNRTSAPNPPRRIARNSMGWPR